MEKKHTTTHAKKLLIVEDEQPLLDVLVDEFREEGYEVRGVRNGMEGVRAALEDHPDLILLDLIMPHMDGIGMLTELRADSWGKTVPVLILTNLEGDAQKTIDAIERGVFEYIVKSRWSLDDIKERVAEKLRGKAAILST